MDDFEQGPDLPALTGLTANSCALRSKSSVLAPSATNEPRQINERARVDGGNQSGHAPTKKESVMRYIKSWFKIVVSILTLSASSYVWAQDPGWPRQIVKPGGTLIIYQPQVDDWKNFTDITWRQAFQLTPSGGKQIVGAATFEGSTEVNTDTHMVFMSNLKVLNTYFPSQDPASSAQLGQLFRTFLPATVNISLERVVAYTPKPQSVKTVPLDNDPPF